MASFQADLVTPDRQDTISAFFRVWVPGLLWAMTVAFFKFYYEMNGYPIPFLLKSPMVWFVLFLPALRWLYTWYHHLYNKRGNLILTDESIEVQWTEPAATSLYSLADVTNLTVVYDGYPTGLFAPDKGTENRLQFNHNGQSYTIYFRLKSEEQAGELAKLLRTWYERSVPFEEYDDEGNETYLLFYHPSNRQAVA